MKALTEEMFMPISMLRTFALLTLVAGCTAQQPVVKAPEPAVPSVSDPALALSQQAVDAVLWQNTSAEAYRCYQQCFELAQMRLDQNLLRAWPKPTAVVVDVDETVLDNSPYEVDVISKGEVYTPDTWKAWTDRASATPLPGALDFLKYAVSRGCTVYYITNRSMEEQKSTIRNLRESGFPMADQEHVLTMGETSNKTERRDKVLMDHSIILGIGDQLRDFDEVFKDRSSSYGKGTVDQMRDTLMNHFIMLPNAMYGTWRDAITGKDDSQKLEQIEEFFQKNALPE